jgi:hypothetical protein
VAEIEFDYNKRVKNNSEGSGSTCYCLLITPLKDNKFLFVQAPFEGDWVDHTTPNDNYLLFKHTDCAITTKRIRFEKSTP